MDIYAEFRNVIRQNPDRVLVFDNKRKLTAEEFDKLTDSIAVKLPENVNRVGIMMDHSVEMIAAIFAVLKTGAAYVPVEPFFPIERIGYMMKEAEVGCIITNSEYTDKVSDIPKIIVDKGFAINTYAPDTHKEASGDSLAYILYTSGSTGKPKGVAVTHGNVLHYVNAFQNEFQPNVNDIMLQYSVCSFDIFVEEVFTTLLSGAALAIPSDEDKNSIERLMQYVDKNKVTIISGFPYLLQDMNSLKAIPKTLRLLISGGDVIRKSYVTNLVDKITVYNTYGPSETTVCAAYYNCSKGETLEDGTYPVGKAIKGTSIKILGENSGEVRKGEVGEICILGGGVSQGYIGSRTEENKAFVTLENGERMYRSGDLGCVLPDGNLAFIRRKDTQVMILGKRVEADEVQNVILEYPDIYQAVVVPYTDSKNLSYLVAYIVPKNDNFDLTALREYMTMYLTSFMIPEFFVVLDKLPLTENGKLDKDSLPVPKKVEIRNADIQELDLLLDWRMEVLRNVFSEEFNTLSKKEIEAIYENNRRYYLNHLESGEHIACFAELDGEIVGCGGVCIYDEMPSPDNIGGKCAYLMNIYTRQEYRRQGIAAKTVEHLIKECKARLIEKIYLETSADGEKMYRQLGFKDMKGYMKL